MSFKNTLRNIITGTAIGAGAIFGVADKAEALPTIELQQLEPHHYSDTWDVTAYITNNTKDVLNEARVDYSDLLGQIANLPHIVSSYSNDGDNSNNLADFISGAKSDHLLGAGIGPLDNQQLGWYADIDSTGNINITRDNLIPGITYVYWDDGLSKEVNLDIADSLLNGYTLELDQNRIVSDMAYAERVNLGGYHEDGIAVNAVPVPEPTTAALVLSGLAAMSATQIKKRK